MIKPSQYTIPSFVSNMSSFTAIGPFSEKSIRFENVVLDTEKVPIPPNFSAAKFGILNFKGISVSDGGSVSDGVSVSDGGRVSDGGSVSSGGSFSSGSAVELVFSVDQSGSMSDKCSDGRSKIHHIIHTLKNMILFFGNNPSIAVNVTIFSFDDNIHEIVNRTAVTLENIQEIIQKIERIPTEGSTNIEKALIAAAKHLKFLKETYPDNNITHIFMTDGEATSGCFNYEVLSGLVIKDVANAFIGFGVEHDASLLNTLSSGEKSSYYFIDKLESSGIVYGEILHGIVYKLVRDATITVVNGLIYDFKTNLWVDTLRIGDIVSEANKTYHLVSEDPSGCVATISGAGLSDIVTIVSDTYDDNLAVYIYRQRTLQLLHAVNSHLRSKASNNYLSTQSFISRPPNRLSDRDSHFKTALKDLFDEMKAYMDGLDLGADLIGFMRNLCDDIYICHRTFGTKYGAMYTSARQTSQGAQRGYNVSQTPDQINLDESVSDSGNNFDNNSSPSTPLRHNTLRHNPLRPPRLVRQNTIHRRGTSFDYGDNSDDETVIEGYDGDVLEFPEINYTPSNVPLSPYVTQQASQVMRAISGGRGVSLI